MQHVQDVARRMELSFPERFKAARRTVVNDIARMRTAYAESYGHRRSEK